MTIKIIMKKKYLILSPETFLWCKKEKGLLYNSKNGKGFSFTNCNDIKKITKKLNKIDNLYSIEIKETELSKPIIDFINIIHSIEAGKLITHTDAQLKPITLPPLLNLQSDIGRIKKESSIMIGEQIMDYLHELTIQICTFENPTSKLINLNSSLINSFLRSVSFSYLSHIHIIGDHVSNYPDLKFLVEILEKMYLIKSFYFNINHVKLDDKLLEVFTKDKFQLVIELSDYMDIKSINHVLKILNNGVKDVLWVFKVQDEIDYKASESIIKKHSLQNLEIKPVYNGRNLKFFTDNIFLTEDDLRSLGLNKREVFAHQILNTNDFGKLTINADGRVFANAHFEPLGTIEDDIRTLINKELTEGKSWLRIRDMKPCCNCVYQWLCPSPCNYELAIGKPNLCHIEL